jgi:hypothetical protein
MAWEAMQSVSGESTHSPSGLLGHYLPCVQCPKPPWPSHWWWSCHAFVFPLLASSGTGSPPAVPCWAETASPCRRPRCTRVMQVL